MTSLPPPPIDRRSGTTEARFDRDQVATILRRATEVAHDRHPIDEHLAVEDLVAVAAEVGISTSAVVTAVAEARAGVDHRRGLVERLVGPRQVWSISQLPSDEETATETMRQWLEVDHGLRTHVTGDGVIIAEPRTGLTGALARGLRSVGGTGGLDRARQVQAATASADVDRSVCLVADVSNKRAEAIAGGTAVAGGTAAVVGLIGILISPFALVAMPVGAAMGVATARAVHRHHVTHVAGRIEMTTEAVVRGQRPEHPVERFLRTRVVDRLRR